MKAIVIRQFGGPEVLRIEEVLDPVPGPGQVVVRNRAIGINPVDTYIRSGQYPALPALPATPGQDAAGEIESIGEGVQELKTGDRVYIWGSITGAYAEKTLCEAWQAHLLPEHVSFEQGASVGVPAGAGLAGALRARRGESRRDRADSWSDRISREISRADGASGWLDGDRHRRR